MDVEIYSNYRKAAAKHARSQQTQTLRELQAQYSPVSCEASLAHTRMTSKAEVSQILTCIARSELPFAEAVQDCEETGVLQTVRKKGQYNAPMNTWSNERAHSNSCRITSTMKVTGGAFGITAPKL